MYLVDKIGWPKFYEQLARIMSIWNEPKNSEATLKTIVNKWNNRNKDVTLLCFSVITLSCDKIEKTFDLTKDLSNFDTKRIALQKRIINYISKYIGINFDLFPHALKKIDKLKDKEEWAKELDDLLCLRFNMVINEKGHAWLEKITEEVVKVKVLFDSFKEDFVEINKLGEYVLKKQDGILNFSWLDDTLFNKWMEDLVHSKQLVFSETDEDEVDQDELQIIHTSIKEEEGKYKQSTIVTSIKVQTDDLAAKELSVTIGLSVHNDLNGEP